MHFILFVMFFITPPALGPNRNWSLQSTQSMEFDSKPACDAAIRTIMASVQTTDTVAVSGWCLQKQGSAAAIAEFKGNAEASSCYQFVPAEIVPDGKQKRADVKHAELKNGQCPLHAPNAGKR